MTTNLLIEGIIRELGMKTEKVPTVSEYYHQRMLGATRAISLILSDLKDLGVCEYDGTAGGGSEGEHQLHSHVWSMAYITFSDDDSPPDQREKRTKGKKRCGSVFDNGTLVSRCVGEKDHSSFHYYPNMLMKKENPALFGKLQKRKTPYLIMRKELLNFDSESGVYRSLRGDEVQVYFFVFVVHGLLVLSILEI